MLKLHIVIPTFNRAGKLEVTLRALEPLYQSTSITVLDNCSTDGTPTVVREVQAHIPELSHVRRPVNIGGNGNILAGYVVGMERGDMVWLLSDDDVLDPVGLRALSEWLANRSASDVPAALIVGACAPRSASIGWPLRGPSQGHEFWYHASLISALVFSRAYLQRVIGPEMYYIGGCYSQMSIIRHLADASAIVESCPVQVLYRGDEENVAAAPAWWMVSWMRAVRSMNPVVRDGAIQAVLGAFPRIPLRFLKNHALYNRKFVGTAYDVGYFDLLAASQGRLRMWCLFYAPLTLISCEIVRCVYRWRKDVTPQQFSHF